MRPREQFEGEAVTPVGDDHDPHVRVLLAQMASGDDGVHGRDGQGADADDHRLRGEVSDQSQKLIEVPGPPHDLDIGHVCEQGGQSIADKEAVGGKNHRDRTLIGTHFRTPRRWPKDLGNGCQRDRRPRQKSCRQHNGDITAGITGFS